ncbi:LPS export ABC transporter periplasmic protein LptC [Propionivibrio sp.]|uniref:LPS export ABC transporter periplasmic protein LptC n=1 Tax=Propionivibrio sp. TaxID=2212460 RepID=UPI003BF3EFDB
MKNWGSALFPLSILLALTALTFWLRYATEMPEERRDGKNRHDPDYIITDATLRKLDQTGRLKYTLIAADIRHYPDNDSTDLTKPNLVYLHASRPTVTMSADRGHISEDGEQADFSGNVRIHRAATAKDEAMIATMPQLTVLPDEEKAYTKSPVLITQGQSWAKGVGMQVDNRAQTYVLESQAFAVLESSHAKKKKP